MKTAYSLILFLLIPGLACSTKEMKTGADKVTFGIYEIVEPDSQQGIFIDSLAVSLKPGALLDNSAIHKAKQVGKNVEIYFNLEGARAWAKITREHTGKKLAFVIDGRIYALPYINAEIRNGMALINGLENEEMAKRIADGLNDR